LRMLTEMGFQREMAHAALVQCGDNLERALDVLARQGQPSSSSSAAAAAVAGRDLNQNMQYDDAINLAIALSKTQAAEADKKKEEEEAVQRNAATVAMNKEQNADQMKSKLKPKKTARMAAKAHRSKDEVSKEKTLKRLAKVLASKPVALDTLVTVLEKIQRNPADAKFRRLRWKNKRFEREIRYTPGAVDFLRAVGFVDTGDSMLMSHTDVALLWSAKETLENQRKGETYMNALREMEFGKVLQSLMSSAGTASKIERERRQKCAENVPLEPDVGAGQQTRIICVIGGTRLERRFPSDADLGHVLNFLGSQSSVLLTKIQSGEWALMNTTTFPEERIEMDERTRGSTLYALGMWPSAELTIRQKG